MSTAISAPAIAPVGTDRQARRIEPGDVVLIEGHVVRGYLTGEGREVVALIVYVTIADGGARRVLDWVGAVPGHDADHPTTGCACYDAGSAVTVLSHLGAAA